MPGYVIHIATAKEYVRNHKEKIDMNYFLRGNIAADIVDIAIKNGIKFSNATLEQIKQAILEEVTQDVCADNSISEEQKEKNIKKKLDMELKKYTHFQGRNGNKDIGIRGTGGVSSLNEFLRYNAQRINTPNNIQERSFYLGYVLHLLTDIAFYNDLLYIPGRHESLYKEEETVEGFFKENVPSGIREDFDKLNDFLINKYRITKEELITSGAWDDMKNWYTYKENEKETQSDKGIRLKKFSSVESVCELIELLGKINLEHYINTDKRKTDIDNDQR